MFAVLGTIEFQTLMAPEQIAAERSWHYAEHRVIEDSSQLQWIADDLESITLDMLFHATFTNPAAQLDALIEAASDHQARPLVFGNGVHRGYFVITSISTIDKQMSEIGDPVSVIVRVRLKQWVPSGSSNSSGLPNGVFSPIAVVAAPAGLSTSVVAYTPPSGAPETSSTAIASMYVAPTLSAVGLSPLLGNPILSGPASAAIVAADIPASTIVRSPV